MADWIFDAVLAGGIVLVAWGSLFGRSLLACVVLFIAFGLLMALAWLRLDAPDIALVEAAVGAGLTGALLLDALAQVEKRRGRHRTCQPQESGDGVTRRGLFAVAAAVAAAMVAMAAWHLPRPDESAGQRVLESMGDHAIDNAATAVLLDVRAYDTFLEMAVLALAGLGVLQLARGRSRAARARVSVPASAIQQALAAVLVPIMFLVAVYLYWSGTAHSGGAFPAGAVLAAAGILVFLSDMGPDNVADGIPPRAVLVLGICAFLAAGFISLAAGGAFLEWGPGWTYPMIVAVEGMLTIAIGGTLAILYTASARRRSARPTRTRGAGQ